jgi:hypothetical protein
MGIHNTALIGASSQGYQIQRSVRLRASASAYLNRTLTTPTLGTKWSWNGWVKRSALGSAQTLFSGQSDVNNWGYFGFLSGDTLTFSQADAGSVTSTVTTTQVFRDASSWYCITVVFDSTQATAADRLKMYVNGSQITAFGTATYLSQNTASRINQATAHQLGRYISAANYLDGYLTEINFIDGQALTPSSFGETNAVTGVWQPKAYTGTYGTNGFELNFSDNSASTAAAIGKDYSGNGNNWTPNIISVTAGTTYDSMLDTPTPFVDGGNGRGNYCTLNPLYKGTSVNPTEGNLKFTMTSGNFHEGITGTIFPTSGKWYAEFLWNTVTAATSATAVCRNNAAMNTTICAFQNTVDTNSPTYRSYLVNGNKDTNTTSAAYGNTYTATDIIGVALDLDNNKVWFSKNGTWQASGDPAAGTNAAFTDITGSDGWTFGVSGYGSGGDNCNANFGQRPFTYTPPTGFLALNTQNLPAPTITNGANHFAATTYTGTGSALSVSNAVNGISFQPDWVWIKGRSVNYSHALFDVNRGVRNVLLSNSTNAETLETAGTSMTAFDSGGFSLGTNGGAASTNVNGSTFVAWQWKAGGTAVTNTNGTISSQVSANPTAGFSIVTYTANNTAGATIGHGLGVAPSFIIVKSRSAVNSWNSYHISLGNTKGFDLNSTSAASTSSNYWNNTSPTSSLFSVAAYTNNLTGTYVAYCFAPVAGYSAFGSYTGNGSTDGPFVFLGFRPRFVLFRSTSARNWVIRDTARDTFNTSTKDQYPDSAVADGAGDAIDLLSNGFKLRAIGATFNGSGEIYTYSAFAENPFKNSLAR